jgi:hypothetical protein
MPTMTILTIPFVSLRWAKWSPHFLLGTSGVVGTAANLLHPIVGAHNCGLMSKTKFVVRRHDLQFEGVYCPNIMALIALGARLNNKPRSCLESDPSGEYRDCRSAHLYNRTSR